MLKMLLFDLDGTLLPMDFDMFVHKYFETVTSFFGDIAEPKFFLRHLIASTEKMIKNPGPFTNQEIFMNSFLPAMNSDEETISLLFDKFYGNEFPKLKKYAGRSALAEKVIEEGFSKGYRMGLATNPVFPRIATEHRMAWAGVERFPWELVTTFENSCGCKPNPSYFSGICKTLGVVPEECLMVGNDVQEDLVAGTLGMETFLVTDCLIDRGKPSYRPDYQGSLKDLHEFISGLPVIGVPEN